MPQLVTAGGQRVGDPSPITHRAGPLHPTKLGITMHQRQDLEATFRDANLDAAEAMHRASSGTMSIFNAGALGLRAWAQACSGLTTAMVSQSEEIWKLQSEAVRDAQQRMLRDQHGSERRDEQQAKAQPGQA